MKEVTAVTVFKDAVGIRFHATYTEIDDGGNIVSDNNHVDRVLTDKENLDHSKSLFDFASSLI
jgi:hypothetical protein